MARILASLLTIVALAAGLAYGTNAFFTDTERSSGHAYTAGALDLTVGADGYYNGVFQEALSWLATDLDNDTLFYQFNDVKPGDWGEHTIELVIEDNTAWVCADVTQTENDDVTCTDPESADDPTCTEPGVGQGELAAELSYLWWADDGDNVLEEGEEIIERGTLGSSTSIALADASGSIADGPLAPGTPHFVGAAWCHGILTPAPVAPGDHSPTDVQGFTCDGTLLSNAAQTDVAAFDVTFRAVQARNNNSFLCRATEPKSSTGQATTELLVHPQVFIDLEVPITNWEFGTALSEGLLGSDVPAIFADAQKGQMLFIFNENGVPVAPVFVPPGDITTNSTTIVVESIADGFIMMNSLMLGFSSADRALILETAQTLPNYSDLLTLIETILTTDPASLSNDTQYPEVYQLAAELVVIAITEAGDESLTAQILEQFRLLSTTPTAHAFNNTIVDILVDGAAEGDGTEVTAYNPTMLFYGIDNGDEPPQVIRGKETYWELGGFPPVSKAEPIEEPIPIAEGQTDLKFESYGTSPSAERALAANVLRPMCDIIDLIMICIAPNSIIETLVESDFSASGLSKFANIFSEESIISAVSFLLDELATPETWKQVTNLLFGGFTQGTASTKTLAATKTFLKRANTAILAIEITYAGSNTVGPFFLDLATKERLYEHCVLRDANTIFIGCSDDNNEPTVYEDRLDILNDTTWTKAGSPYLIEYVRIDEGATLNIEPGVIVKIGGDTSGIRIMEGSLNALGSASEPIVITDHRDDTVGGDTNGDGADTAPDDFSGRAFYRITARDENSQVVMDHVNIRYARDAGLEMRGSGHATVTNAIFEHSDIGIEALFGSTVVVQDSEFRDGNFGMISDHRDTTVLVERSRFADLEQGINLGYWSLTGASGMVVTVRNSDFSGLFSEYAFVAGDGTGDVRQNWWGDPSGPYINSNPDGTGSAIVQDEDDILLYDPWLTTVP